MQDDSNLATLHIHFRNKQGINMGKKPLILELQFFPERDTKELKSSKRKLRQLQGDV